MFYTFGSADNEQNVARIGHVYLQEILKPIFCIKLYDSIYSGSILGTMIYWLISMYGNGIPVNLLKMCAYEIAGLNWPGPTAIRLENIVAVFKKGERGRVENYRFISLSSVTSKLLEHIIHSNIMDSLDTHSLSSTYISMGFDKTEVVKPNSLPQSETSVTA